MIHWLAADPAPQGSNNPPWLAYLTLIVTLSVPFVAGLFSMRTTRKTPHEKLEKLVGVLKDWPKDADGNDLAGKETVHQAIELTLGEIREVDKLADLPQTKAVATPASVSESEKKVDLIVQARTALAALTRRRVMGMLYVAVGIFLPSMALNAPDLGATRWFVVAYGLFYLVGGIAVFFNLFGMGDIVLRPSRARHLGRSSS